MLNANKKGINVVVKVNINEKSKIEENNLYIILGNAIDNAIQSFDFANKEHKNIAIGIFDDNNNLFIKITNPYEGTIKFKNGLPLTTKKDKSMHGIGLKSIKKLVEDKNGYFKIAVTDNIFTLELLLYDEIRF